MAQLRGKTVPGTTGGSFAPGQKGFGSMGSIPGIEAEDENLKLRLILERGVQPDEGSRWMTTHDESMQPTTHNESMQPTTHNESMQPTTPEEVDELVFDLRDAARALDIPENNYGHVELVSDAVEMLERQQRVINDLLAERRSSEHGA